MSDEVEMFSFRQDKVGFFVTLILIVIAAGTLISSLVLVVVGVAYGDWKMFSIPMKIVLASAWVLCIATVLTRVGIFRMQMLRAEQARAAAHAAAINTPPIPLPLPTDSKPEPTHGGASSNGGPPLPQPLPHGDHPEPA